MRPIWLVILAIAAAVHGQAPAQSDPAIQVDFSNPSLAPSQWMLILHPDGSGHFRSPMGKPPAGADGKIGTPAVDRDIHVSGAYAAQVFAIAQRQKGFNIPCESHLKVAFQGWKTFTLTGSSLQGSCTFNYSKINEIQKLSDSLEAVTLTILEGARLELLFQHDRLGLDPEMEYLVGAADEGQAQQLGAISEILDRLANDDQVLDRVRKRARYLLARAAQ